MVGFLWTGVSGLSVHQAVLDNESHNIANVNTIGYKSSRISFIDQLYQDSIGYVKAHNYNGKLVVESIISGDIFSISISANATTVSPATLRGNINKSTENSNNERGLLAQGNILLLKTNISGEAIYNF